MVLVLSSLEKIVKSLGRVLVPPPRKLQNFVALLFFLTGTAESSETYDAYDKLSYRLMNVIGSSKQRVWIRTKHLTDGHIVMGLNLAKFRGVDVKILLHKEKAKHYMSRYRTLKKENIPTSIVDETWDYPTSLIVDNRAYHVSSPLNYKANTRYVRLERVANKNIKDFSKQFLKNARFYKIHKKSLPRPSVSRPVIKKSTNRDKKNNSIYIYSNKTKKTPKGLPTKLPKKTIWQKNR